jgi:hypothetical protein
MLIDEMPNLDLFLHCYFNASAGTRTMRATILLDITSFVELSADLVWLHPPGTLVRLALS